MCKANHAAERSYAQCEITASSTAQITLSKHTHTHTQLSAAPVRLVDMH